MTGRRARRPWGSSQQIEALYADHLEQTRRLCHRLLGDPAAAEDAAQEAFKRVIERAAAGGFQRRPSRYLLGEARRICRDLLRGSARESVVVRILLTPEDDPAALVADSVELSEYVDHLTEPQKAVLAQIYAGYEVKEIAHRSGWPYGTAASRLGRIRDRARRMHDKLGALVAMGGMRLRRWRLDAAGVHQASLTAATASLIAFVGSPVPTASVPGPAVALPGDHVMADFSRLAAHEEPSTIIPTVRGAVTSSRSVTQSVAGTASAPGHKTLVPLVSPAHETPSDSDIQAVAASPHYDEDHTIVAIGLGHSCSCPVIFRSKDGGATWQSSVQAVPGTQVLLAPNFRGDGRIFIGQPAGSLSPDWVSSGWGQPFIPLPAPPGPLAAVGSRLLSAGATAVWSFDGKVVAPVVSYQGPDVAVLASTPTTAYIVAPAHAVGPGPTITSGPSLYACTEAACRYVGPVPIARVQLLAAYDTTVAVVGLGHLALSRDGGASFADVTPPVSVRVLSVAASGTMLWSVVQTGDRTAVFRRAADDAWQVAAAPARVQAVAGVTGARVLALLEGGGTVCSTDSGRTWEASCPAEG